MNDFNENEEAEKRYLGKRQLRMSVGFWVIGAVIAGAGVGLGRLPGPEHALVVTILVTGKNIR